MHWHINQTFKSSMIEKKNYSVKDVPLRFQHSSAPASLPSWRDLCPCLYHDRHTPHQKLHSLIELPPSNSLDNVGLKSYINNCNYVLLLKNFHLQIYFDLSMYIA